MARYTITHTCGHTSTVELFGKGSEREWRISKMESQPCPECQHATAALRIEEASDKYYTVRYADFKSESGLCLTAVDGTYDSISKTISVTSTKILTKTRVDYKEYKKVDGLVAVDGTYDASTKTIEAIVLKPSPIEQASETLATEVGGKIAEMDDEVAADIRSEICAIYLEKMDRAIATSTQEKPFREDDFKKVFKSALLENNPLFWIEFQRKGHRFFIEYTKKVLSSSAPKTHDPIHKTTAPAEKATTAALQVVTPENQTHAGVVSISYTSSYVQVSYPRDEDFRLLVKLFDFLWDSGNKVWNKKITQFTGTSENCTTEIGSALLNAGFAISLDDEEIRARCVNAEFEPTCKYWVKIRSAGTYEGWLSICWPKGEQEIYDAARKISGSKWSSPNVVIPITKTEEVKDFANHLGFKISAGAAEAMDSYQKSLRPPVIPETGKKSTAKNTVHEILKNTNDEILGDLIDD